MERKGQVPVYYNDIDPISCVVTRELIHDGLLPEGFVDERSITEVQADDLVGFTWCSFFNGSGAWVYALELAGWPRDRNTWIASLPCQPWSCAGKGEGEADERHLWPIFRDLGAQCRPDFIFGEQVTGAIGKGWLDGVRSDLEQEGYACGVVVLPACGQGEEEAILLSGPFGLREACVLVGPPHIRARIFWGAVRVANSNSGRLPINGWSQIQGHTSINVASSSSTVRLADNKRDKPERQRIPGDVGSQASMQSGKEDQWERTGDAVGDCCENVWLEHNQSDGRDTRGTEPDGRGAAGGCYPTDRVGNSPSSDERRLPESAMHGEGCAAGRSGGNGGVDNTGSVGTRHKHSRQTEQSGDRTNNGILGATGTGMCYGMENTRCGTEGWRLLGPGKSSYQDHWQSSDEFKRSSGGIWSDYTIVTCRDKTKGGIHKARRIPRPVEPGVFVCADGTPVCIPAIGSPGNIEIQGSAEVSTFPLSPPEAWKGTRVGLLKLAGNAIVPTLAAQFVKAFMECVEDCN